MLPEDFAHSAAYPLFRLDPLTGLCEVLHLRAVDYRDAAFLDDRLLAQRRFGGWRTGFEDIEARLQAQPATHSAHFLFHIGHCGSTLLSRLLDALPGVLGLREPLPLLALADRVVEVAQPTSRIEPARFESMLTAVSGALRRGFADTRHVVVKPTSLCTALAGPLLQQDTGARAVLLGMRLDAWLPIMLRDPGLRATARQQARERVAAWHALGGEPSLRLWQLDDAELLALCWLVEQLRWREWMADALLGPRLRHLDFDHFLVDPLGKLGALASHFGIEASEGELQAALGSGLMQRYSKDPRQVFDAGTREREMAGARERHRKEIERGLRWAETALERLGIDGLAAEIRGA
jgi:hypothetical protein